MKHFLFYLIFSTLSFGAPSPLQELNQLAKDTLSEKGEIQKKLTDDLETKLNTDLGISLPTVRQSIVSLEGGKYSIEIPAEAGCNPWANDLAGKDKGYRDVLESQIQSAAAFLSDFHFRMLGQSHSLFRIRRILICTGGRGITEPKVSYDRARAELTLWIGPHQVGSLPVPSIRRDNLNGLSLEDIRSKWNEGEHFGKQLSFEELVDRNKNPMRAYWNFLNPTGEIRTLLRDAIRVAALKSAGLLDELRRRDGLAGIREKLASLSDNKEIILKADDKKVEEWAKSWQEKMASPAGSEEMAGGGAHCRVVQLLRPERDRTAGARTATRGPRRPPGQRRPARALRRGARGRCRRQRRPGRWVG